MPTLETHTDSNTPLSEFVSKTKFAISEENPLSDTEFNYLFKNREQNGFAKAFVKFSARGFLVHVPTFIDRLNAKRGA